MSTTTWKQAFKAITVSLFGVCIAASYAESIAADPTKESQAPSNQGTMYAANNRAVIKRGAAQRPASVNQSSGFRGGFSSEPAEHDDLITSEFEHTKTIDKEAGPAGWRITSNGGLAYGNPADKRYWVQISGIARIDQVNFIGGSYRDRGTDFPNSANLRKLQTNVSGGVGPHWEYTLELNYGQSSKNAMGALVQNTMELGDLWISYSGFAKNNEVFIGNMGGYWYGLDNATSTSWGPFMEKSLATAAFYPGDGPGVMTDMWWDDACITLIASTPEHGTHIINEDGTQFYGRDRWRAIGRFTVAPIHECGNVWHFGLSGAYRRNDADLNGIPNSDFGLSTNPGERSRNQKKLVKTGDLRANYARQFNFEAAHQCGPVIIDGEYSHIYVHRVGDPLRTVRFHGWDLEARYMLTGEVHKYDVRDGNFGSFDILNPDIGAWEIAARVDYINLNDKNVVGGSETNVTVGLSWFANANIRLTANYVRANIHPAASTANPTFTSVARHVDIFGVRAQVRFH